MDLQDALQFAGVGKVRAHYLTNRLERGNDIFGEMKQGRIDGRIVLQF
jgi:alcohol dehydrogenase, propanol-preferring